MLYPYFSYTSNNNTYSVCFRHRTPLAKTCLNLKAATKQLKMYGIKFIIEKLPNSRYRIILDSKDEDAAMKIVYGDAP